MAYPVECIYSYRHMCQYKCLPIYLRYENLALDPSRAINGARTLKQSMLFLLGLLLPERHGIELRLGHSEELLKLLVGQEGLTLCGVHVSIIIRT